tara:strand:- start:228 stop:791 length:564 start_codon:yes stop_codon:yes gene_type:complete
MKRVRRYSEMIRKRIALYPTPIYEIQLDLDNKKLIQVIEDHREKYPKREVATNVNAWRSSYNTHQINKNFDPFIKRILEAIDEVRKIDLKNFSNLPSINYNVQEFWALMYGDGDNAFEHTHFPYTWALTYYAYADEDSEPIQFKTLRIKPRSGMLLLWPGSLFHSVSHTKGKRIAVAANLMVQLLGK